MNVTESETETDLGSGFDSSRRFETFSGFSVSGLETVCSDAPSRVFGIGFGVADASENRT